MKFDGQEYVGVMFMCLGSNLLFIWETFPLTNRSGHMDLNAVWYEEHY